MTKQTIDIIKDVVKANPIVKNIFLHSFPTSMGIEKRISFSQLENDHFEKAIQFRNLTKIGFWDSLMLTYFDREFFSRSILDHMLNHHARRERFALSSEQVLNDSLLQYKNALENFALNSMVETFDGKKMHFVLLDFHIPESTSNQKVVESLLDSLGLSNGFLLRSGKSYHYMSNFLVRKSKLDKILYKSIFYSPIIDKYWIAHQLLDNSCSIRITPKNGFSPTLIKKI